MPFQVKCPNCAARLTAKESMIGREVACPKCTSTVSIVAPASPNVAAANLRASSRSNAASETIPQDAMTNLLSVEPSAAIGHGGDSFNMTHPYTTPKSSVSMFTILAIAGSLGVALLLLVLIPFAAIGFLFLFVNPKSDDSSTAPRALASAAELNPEQRNNATRPLFNTELASGQAADARIANDRAVQTTQSLEAQSQSAAASRNIAAWKEMRQCDNQFERLSRDSQLDYWESMRQGYGAIDTQGVDIEFVNLLQSYRELFLTYANTLREWERERAPLVDALNSVEQPASFGEGLVVGIAAGVAMAAVEEIDNKYKSEFAGLQAQMNLIQSQESALRQTLSDRHGVEFP
jgi:hypothetical protein